MIDIDFGDIGKPKFARPDLLNNEIIPLCLAGVNPRTLMGEAKWKAIRIKAYNKNNRCCWACGRTPGQDRFKNHLEAHERYKYDITSCSAHLIEVVALCRTCHFFVHIGRTVTKARLKNEDILHVLHHGLTILNTAELSVMPLVIQASTLFISPKELEEKYPYCMKADDRARRAFERHFAKHRGCEYQWVLAFEGKMYRASARTGKPKEVKGWQRPR